MVQERKVPRRSSVELSDLIVGDPKVMSGAPCFRGARVPVSVLFENLAAVVSIDEVLEAWPSLRCEDVLAVLELAGEESAADAWIRRADGRGGGTRGRGIRGVETIRAQGGDAYPRAFSG
jgi:uncharacterized protein (DUF433 family)